MRPPVPPSFAAALAARPHLAVAAFSLAMLGAALAFQFVGGMAPCPLCVDQRWAHVAALSLALAAAALPTRVRRLVTAAAGAALLAGAAVAGYHVGVENHWWAASCAIAPGAASSVADLKAMLMAAPVVRCDEIPWSMLGISMAGWNGLASLAVGAAALALGLRPAPRPGAR